MLRKKQYQIESFTLTKENIGSFKVMENRRQISDYHVSKIHGALLEGKNPVGILIVNKRKNEVILIDGNHRLEAVKRFFAYRKSYAKVKIECILKIYTNLTDEEERQVYADEARRRNESYEDRLNMYKDVMTFWKLLQDKLNKFPCKVSIYQSTETLKFRIILNALNTAKGSSSEGYYPKYISKDNIVEFAIGLGYNDYLLMKEFIIFFQQVFGDVGTSNVYIKTNFFIPLFDLYTKNKKYKEDKNFKERFARIIGKPDLINYMNMGGREAQSRIRLIMIDYANWHIGKNLFI